MKFTVSENDNLKNYINYNKAKLGILKFSDNNVKNTFYYKNESIEYGVFLSNIYGVVLFVNFFDVDTLKKESIDESEEQLFIISEKINSFKNLVNEEYSRFPKSDLIDLNIFAYFPKLSADYFTEDLFASDSDDILSLLTSDLKSFTDGKIISSIVDVNTIIRNITITKDNNDLLNDPDNLNLVWTLFSSHTSIDMNHHLVYSKQSKEISDMLVRFELDSDQIEQVEKYNSENRMIVARAGTGKSVVLFSKAQRLAVLNPEKEFLIVTYNKYLQEEYQNKVFYENMKLGKIITTTLDRLIKGYVEDYHFNDDIDKHIDYLLSSDISMKKYAGIFIDEVQLFKPKWLDFCYNLLSSKNAGEYSFIIAGDINQASKSLNYAPWRQTKIPSFQGRSIKLTKTYRSTDSINSFSKDLANNIFTYYNKNNLEIAEIIKSDVNYDLEINNNNKMDDLLSNEYEDVEFFSTSSTFDDRMDRYDEVVDKIIEISDRGIDLREMVVLFPFTKSFGISYINRIQEKLSEHDIKFVSTVEDDAEDEELESRNIRYSDIKGQLSFTSVDRATGLDFNYVMVVGLETFGNLPNKLVGKVNIKDSNKPIDYDYLTNHISKLYIILTRARKKLFIELSRSFITRPNLIYRPFIFGDDNE